MSGILQILAALRMYGCFMRGSIHDMGIQMAFKWTNVLAYLLL